MSEKEKKLAKDIMDVFDRLPEAKKQRLLGVAEGLDMASATPEPKEKKEESA